MAGREEEEVPYEEERYRKNSKGREREGGAKEVRRTERSTSNQFLCLDAPD